jgi:tetratricopeptide (TPR) repeat protein
MKKTLVFYILTLLLTSNLLSQNKQLFDEGNTLYSDGKYQEAIDKYQAVLDSGVHSAEVYFNLGNAHYKLNHIAPSIFYYEKALQLNPDDKDIRNNLSYAQNMTIDAIETLPELGISRFFKKVVKAQSFDTWAMIAIVFMMLFVVSVLGYFFTYQTASKRFSFILGLLAISFTLICLVFALKKYDLDAKDNPAIVFAQESTVKTDPNLKGETLFLLHEGTKVQVLDHANNWYNIKLADGKTGWIPGEDVRVLGE